MNLTAQATNPGARWTIRIFHTPGVALGNLHGRHHDLFVSDIFFTLLFFVTLRCFFPLVQGVRRNFESYSFLRYSTLAKIPGVARGTSLESWHIHPKHPLDSRISGNLDQLRSQLRSFANASVHGQLRKIHALRS